LLFEKAGLLEEIQKLKEKSIKQKDSYSKLNTKFGKMNKEKYDLL